ncbi:MAG: hypothetical protein ACE5KX_02040 [Acidimicrobiia bacterium]
MDEPLVYQSRIRVEPVRGPTRHAWLPALEEPITFGVHGAVAEHYGVNTSKVPAQPTTLDYVVAAAGG